MNIIFDTFDQHDSKEIHLISTINFRAILSHNSRAIDSSTKNYPGKRYEVKKLYQLGQPDNSIGFNPDVKLHVKIQLFYYLLFSKVVQNR